MTGQPVVRRVAFTALIAATSIGVAGDVRAADWARFRGPNGTGVASDNVRTPVEWNDQTNLKWSVDLPGKGKSCPIVVGDRVIVTSWTGEDQTDLIRHLLCFDRKTGQQLSDTPVKPTVTEDPYEGMFRETGYTAHTPTSDGERIYAFFGRCGVYAFDMRGNELWHKSVGTGSDRMKWGTASSPVIYKDLVIVTAGPESNTIYGLDGATGDEVWKYTDESLSGLWATPIVVNVSQSRDDLVLGTSDTIWGLDPKSGDVRWHCQGSGDGKSSVFAHDGVVYAFGGGRDGGGSLAVRAGGEGDVEQTHVVWRNGQRGGVGTPVFADGRIYLVSGGVARWFDPATGERIDQQRLQSPSGEDAGPASDQPDDPPAGRPPRGPGEDRPAFGGPRGPEGPTEGPGGPRGRREGFGPTGEQGQGPGGGPGNGFDGRRGGGGGRGGFNFRSQDYSSPVVADGKLYFVARQGAVYVLQLGDELKQLATNQFGSDEADFSATPAIADGQIFIRSTEKLYCIEADD